MFRKKLFKILILLIYFKIIEIGKMNIKLFYFALTLIYLSKCFFFNLKKGEKTLKDE